MSGLQLLRAGTSAPEPGGRHGAGGPGSRSRAHPAKTEDVRAATGYPPHAGPGDRARAGPRGGTCSWASQVPDTRWL